MFIAENNHESFEFGNRVDFEEKSNQESLYNFYLIEFEQLSNEVTNLINESNIWQIINACTLDVSLYWLLKDYLNSDYLDLLDLFELSDDDKIKLIIAYTDLGWHVPNIPDLENIDIYRGYLDEFIKNNTELLPQCFQDVIKNDSRIYLDWDRIKNDFFSDYDETRIEGQNYVYWTR